MHFDESILESLSFPDFEIENFVFNLAQKKLQIEIEGAWLDLDGGKKLGRGVLLFHAWETIIIRTFMPEYDLWSTEDVFSVEHLKDLCEIKYHDTKITLSGFGKKNGLWMEWAIEKFKFEAEFDLNQK